MDDGEGAINLFEEHDTDDLVVEGHGGEGECHIDLFFKEGIVADGRAGVEKEVFGAFVEVLFDECGQGFRSQVFTGRGKENVYAFSGLFFQGFTS